MSDELLAQAEAGLKKAQALHVQQAEVYLWRGRSWEARAGKGHRSVHQSDGSGVQARVLIDGRLASATTTGTSATSVAWAVSRSVALARILPETKAGLVLGAPSGGASSLSIVHPALVEPDPARLLRVADAVQARLDSIRGLDYASSLIATHEGRFCVANTEGVRVWDRTAHESVKAEVRGEGAGGSQTIQFSRYSRDPFEPTAALLADVEASASVARAGRAKVALGEAVREVVFDAPTAAEVVFSIIPSFAGNAAVEERSRLRTLGAEAFSPAITIVDDPTDAQSIRHYHHDDEGTPAIGRLQLVERGVIRGHAHSIGSARKAACAPTGHGLRGGTSRYATSVRSKAANARIEPGGSSFDDLVASCERAVVIRGGLLGSFTVNALTGDLSCTATMAQVVENGRILGELKPVTLTGNVFDALREVRGVGNDPVRVPRGSCPSLRMGGFTVSA